MKMADNKRQLITFGRIIRTGAVNFVRNMSLAIAAMAVMVVTLTIILFSLVANATFSNTIESITSKIDVSVYLKDSTSEAETERLLADLRQLPNVQSVDYLSKEEAAEEFLSRDEDSSSELRQAVLETGNPIPATIHVFPKDLSRVESVQQFLLKPENKQLQTPKSPSYSGDRKEAIDNITHAANVLRRIGVLGVLVFAIVSALIIFNTIQMAIFNRRNEIQTMRLLGASTWYIRGPFVVEGVIYGVVAGLLSVAIIDLTFVGASSALQASSLGLLDINYASVYFKDHLWQFLTLQTAIGIVLGAVSSVIATRRYLKFKPTK